jgi:hypothetical protein
MAGALALAAACAGLCVLYWCQSRTAPFNSDGAANVLQGRAIIDGNPLLRGWWTSDVSFYTTEVPEYALVTAVRGLTPDVVHWCGALSYTLTVLLVTSGGRVLVAPFVISAGRAGRAGKAAADRWESAAWYQPGQQAAIFVIAAASPAAPGAGLPAANLLARFGPPVAEHRIGQQLIMLYHYNLLTRLSGASFPGFG